MLQVVHEQVRWEPSHETEQDAEEAAARAPTRPTLVALSLHAHGVPGAVLAAGERGAVVVSEHGRELAAVEFPLPPTQRLVVADFNGDGLNDLVEVTATGLFGWTQVRAGAGGAFVSRQARVRRGVRDQAGPGAAAVNVCMVACAPGPQVQHVGGGTLSTLLLVATAAMALLVWNSGGFAGGGGGGPGGAAAQRKLRSTEYTD